MRHAWKRMVRTRSGPAEPKLLPVGRASARSSIPIRIALAHAAGSCGVEQFTARPAVIQFTRLPRCLSSRGGAAAAPMCDARRAGPPSEPASPPAVDGTPGFDLAEVEKSALQARVLPVQSAPW